jgi:uncharacterized repeat protein (TIGR03803 family)
MRRRFSCARVLTLSFVAILLLGSICQVWAQTESILYNFTGYGPNAPVVIDKHGNVFGTLGLGTGGGSAYELTASGEYLTLYAFTGSYPDGNGPVGNLAIDQEGNLYGATVSGGAYGGGIIFEISPTGTETILHSFNCNLEGCYPNAGVTMDAAGTLYGATSAGGSVFLGTAYKFVPSSGALTTLYNFLGGEDGCLPYSVALDNSGNLYGTTEGGCGGGYGLVFKVTQSGSETVLHSFSRNGKDGFQPISTVVVDAKGNVYGTTTLGGSIGIGTVFKITPAGKETILHNFKGGADGFFPEAGPILDANGTLYGTTIYGGTLDAGTVFKLVKSKETILYSFGSSDVDGVSPEASPALDAGGNLYGTTIQGGAYGGGTIFKISPEALSVTTAPDPN